MESPVIHQLAKASNQSQNLSCQALLYPRDHGGFMHQVNRKRFARPMLTVHELQPTANSGGRGDAIKYRKHDPWSLSWTESDISPNRTEMQSSESQILCSSGSWCLLVSNCSDNNSTTNIRITLVHLQANELGVEAPKTNSALLTTIMFP